MIFFAHTHHLTLIESNSCKKQVRRIHHSPAVQTLPVFSTASKHPEHSNARNSIPFMSLLHVSLDTPGLGWDSHPCLFPYRLLHLRFTGHGPRNAGHVFSARLCVLRASALSFLFSSHQSRITSHRFQNFYPPASDLRHNPAAQGHVSAALNQQAHSSSRTGRIQ